MGEALVSVLDTKGVPTVVQRAKILPPRSSMAAAEEGALRQAMDASPLKAKYQQTLDRESAFELLTEHREREEQAAAAAAAEKEKEKEKSAKKPAPRKSSGRKTSTAEKALNSAVTSMSRELGKQIVRGLFGTRKKR